MRMMAYRGAGRPFIRIAAACLLTAAAIPVAACGAPASGADSGLRDTVLRHERLIAECMKERGFEYVVGLPSSVLAEEARQQAKAEGGDAHAAVEKAQADAVNPNEATLAALSPEQQARWGDALWGDANRRGCYDHTYAAAWGVSPGDLTSQAEALLAKAKADPAVVAAAGEYVSCMAARGHTLDHPDNLETMIGRNAERLDEQAAEAYGTAVLADHEVCAGPYNKALAEAYERLSQ